MAEAVSAAAAAVQFLDVTVRLSSALAKLCSDVRHVPERFQRLQSDLKQHIALVRELEANHSPAFTAAIASSALKPLLQEYVTIADDLCTTLETLLDFGSKPRAQRVWQTFCATRKQDEIERTCDRLERHKSTLSVWLSGASLALSSNTSTAINQIRATSDDTFAVAKIIEVASTKAASGTEKLSDELGQMSLELGQSSQKQDQLILLTGDHSRMQAQIGLSIEVSSQKQDRLGLTVEGVSQKQDQTMLAIASFNQMQEQMIQGLDEKMMQILQQLITQQQPQRRQSPPRTKNENPLRTATLDLRLSEGYTKNEESTCTDMSNLKISDESTGMCTCWAFQRARRWQPMSMVCFTRSFRVQHLPYCPAYVNSERTFKVSMRIVPPTWLLSQAIDIGFKVTSLPFWQRTSISPVVIGTSRLVDSSKSPAFRAVWDCRRQLYGGVSPSVCVPRLQDKLQRLFDQGQASPLDTDRQGRTVLNEVLRISDDRQYFSELDSSGALVPLISFLLAHKSDPNIHQACVVSSLSGTVLDQHAYRLRFGDKYKSPAGIASDLTIYKKLRAAGGEFSKPNDDFLCVEWEISLKQFVVFEDQVELCDLGDLVPIILQQDKKRLERALGTKTLQQLDRKSSVNHLTTTHFAVTWPHSLRLLIERGVNVDAEDIFGRKPLHFAIHLSLNESIDLLVDADCSLYSKRWRISFLQDALCLKCPSRQRTVEIISTALVDRHSRLLERARTFLPPSEFSKLRMDDRRVADVYAPRIINVLTSHGIDVPAALELSGESLYNSPPIDFGARIVINFMRPDDAEVFWAAGFTDIDVPNATGWTPILQCVACAAFDMVAWLSEKGADITSTHRKSPLTALHLFANRIAQQLWWPRGNYPVEAATAAGCMAKLHQHFGVPYDNCRCPCSPNGCSPTNFLLRPDYGNDMSIVHLFRYWVRKAAVPASLLPQSIRDFTRQVVFVFVSGRHTCCKLDDAGAVVSREHESQFWPYQYHVWFCEDLPVFPRDRYALSEDQESLRTDMDHWMSFYDDMPRPSTMPPESQPLNFIRWLIASGHMDFVPSHCGTGNCEKSGNGFFFEAETDDNDDDEDDQDDEGNNDVDK